MKAHTLIVAVVAIASLVSCAGLVSPSTQAKIDQAGQKYESATGISTGQTVSLVGKWWQDYQQAKEINALLKTEVIRATKASPVTSTKDVINVSPLTSFVPAPQPVPTPEPTEDKPRKGERPSPRDPPQLLASH